MWIYIIYLFINIQRVFNRCLHDFIHAPINSPQPLPKNAIIPNITPTPLNMFIYYDEKIKEIPKFQIFKKQVEAAKDKINAMVKVKYPVKSPFKVKKDCYKNFEGHSCAFGCLNVSKCYEVEIPIYLLEKCAPFSTDHDGTGQNDTQLIILISTLTGKGNDTFCNKNYPLVGSECFRRQPAVYRPLMGEIRLCTEYYNSNLDLTSAIIHQIFHIMFFSYNLFSYYVDDTGHATTTISNNGIPSGNKTIRFFPITKKVAVKMNISRVFNNYKTEETHIFIVTKRVKEEVRKHFGCNTLSGLIIEENDMVKMGHLEQEFFGNELMTSNNYFANRPLSRITLALMEDSGWYIPDYSFADNLTFGKNAGCKFMEGCYSKLLDIQKKNDSNTVNYYCLNYQGNNGRVYTCSDDNKFMMICGAKAHKHKVADEYDYLGALKITNDPKNYYDDAPGKYCPVYKLNIRDKNGNHNEANKEAKPATCLNPEYNSDPMWTKSFILKNTFGPDSLCLNILQLDADVVYGAMCFTMACETLDSITVYAERLRIMKCEKDYEIKTWSYNGKTLKIQCPKVTNVCTSTVLPIPQLEITIPSAIPKEHQHKKSYHLPISVLLLILSISFLFLFNNDVLRHY